MDAICGSIKEGLEDRKNTKDKTDSEEEAAKSVEKVEEVTAEAAADETKTEEK